MAPDPPPGGGSSLPGRRDRLRPVGRISGELTTTEREITVSKATLRAASLLALAAALLATVGVPAASAAPADKPTTAVAKATTAGIKGWGRMDWPQPGNDIQVSVDAHGSFDREHPSTPARSWGTFRITHRYNGPAGPA
ncbi:hypothetical protein ACIHFE_12295 [Streptomyces sp. NPDC052396]|uniref:hypothetical protein n=1 Tax=Streptomyces sp. NPDC052396 TaxID=3365689 RepID=UPI0037D0AD1C